MMSEEGRKRVEGLMRVARGYKARQKERHRAAKVDSEVLLAGAQLATFHIEAGSRKFVDYARAMVNDMGEGLRPYLKMFYNSVRDYPGFDSSGMDDYHSVAAVDVNSIRMTREVPKMEDLAMALAIKRERAKYEAEEVLHNRELHQEILESWARHSPKMTANLKRLKILDDMAFVSQERMWRRKKELMKAGYPLTDAREVAEREELMLEPEADAEARRQEFEARQPVITMEAMQQLRRKIQAK